MNATKTFLVLPYGSFFWELWDGSDTSRDIDLFVTATDLKMPDTLEVMRFGAFPVRLVWRAEHWNDIEREVEAWWRAALPGRALDISSSDIAGSCIWHEPYPLDVRRKAIPAGGEEFALRRNLEHWLEQLRGTLSPFHLRKCAFAFAQARFFAETGKFLDCKRLVIEHFPALRPLFETLSPSPRDVEAAMAMIEDIAWPYPGATVRLYELHRTDKIEPGDETILWSGIRSAWHLVEIVWPERTEYRLYRPTSCDHCSWGWFEPATIEALKGGYAYIAALGGRLEEVVRLRLLGSYEALGKNNPEIAESECSGSSLDIQTAALIVLRKDVE